MKTKTKMIFSAALAAALIALPRAQAATSGAAPTNAPAAATAAAAATNSKPADVMAALFGDPVIAKGNGFEIKQSQLDSVVDALKARTAAMGQTVAPEELAKNGLEQPDCEPDSVAEGDRCRQGRPAKRRRTNTSPKRSNITARRRWWKSN